MIPDYQSLMLPLMLLVSDGKEYLLMASNWPLGVTRAASYDIKKLDNNYLSED